MRIIVAKTAGFCMGVKRAVDIALENAGKSPEGLKTIGPLIHNQQTLAMLRQRKVSEFDEAIDNARPATLLIRAHGIPPGTQERYAARGHTIIDGTCPKVKTVHKVIERYRAEGYSIVIAGDRGHAEVIGHLGYAGDAGYLINSADEIGTLPDLGKICLVAQTTFDRTVFDGITARMLDRYKNSEVVVKKTICAATDQRQAETEDLARQVEAMIVVGGKNSANTRRLAEIARNAGTPTLFVETEEEINWNDIARCASIGVTAGASTPNWMIKRVTEWLQLMDRSRQRTAPNFLRTLLDSAANLNVFVALGAAAALYVSCRIQGYPFTWAGGALAFLYFLSMYLWNGVTNLESTQHLGISRYTFYRRYRPLLLLLAAASIAALLAWSFSLGRQLFFLVLFATAAGSVYHVTIVPGPLRRFLRYKKLKDIPTSRDLFVALAWAIVLTFIPQAMNGSFVISPPSAAAFGWIFILAFLRSLIFDLRDIEGDRIMGRETLITIVGEKKARAAIYGITWLCIASLAAAPLLAGRTSFIYLLSQIPALVYAMLFVKWNPRLKSNIQVVFNVMADAVFYLAGLGALCTYYFLTYPGRG
ncbi:MAG: 4-hydroxy-3-methylbut-2-enyl diphosphate reductase [Chitinispirillaceae bacterium]|nr:4-hydroxy-3-methylbut-2-enyl diphosphate reductase [Chitinispirillaceae bacterium]